MITTLAPVETRLAENPPRPRRQISAERGKETPARRRNLTAFIGEYDVPHGHKCIGNSHSYLASQVIVATSGETECIVVSRPRLTAGWHLYGGDDLDALQHCRDQRRRDPIIAEAALASDSQKPRGNQLAQVAARRRARDIRAVSSSVAVSNWPPIRALSIVARAVSPTRAATSTRFAAATILNPIADTGSISIENSLAWAKLFA